MYVWWKQTNVDTRSVIHSFLAVFAQHTSRSDARVDNQLELELWFLGANKTPHCDLRDSYAQHHRSRNISNNEMAINSLKFIKLIKQQTITNRMSKSWKNPSLYKYNRSRFQPCHRRETLWGSHYWKEGWGYGYAPNPMVAPGAVSVVWLCCLKRTKVFGVFGILWKQEVWICPIDKFWIGLTLCDESGLLATWIQGLLF